MTNNKDFRPLIIIKQEKPFSLQKTQETVDGGGFFNDQNSEPFTVTRDNILSKNEFSIFELPEFNKKGIKAIFKEKFLEYLKENGDVEELKKEFKIEFCLVFIKDGVQESEIEDELLIYEFRRFYPDSNDRNDNFLLSSQFVVDYYKFCDQDDDFRNFEVFELLTKSLAKSN